MSDNKFEITESRYNEACDNNEGFCTICLDFTTDGVEPDAENYECPDCGCDEVFGVEQALILDLILIKDE